MGSLIDPASSTARRHGEPAPPLTILVAEDDDGHAELIHLLLEESGVGNRIIRFVDGQKLLNFLLGEDGGAHVEDGVAYLVLLDIRMPKVDGTTVLARIKAHPVLRRIPVIMLTTADDPRVVETCYDLGCSAFIIKPMEAEAFFEALRRLGLFIQTFAAPRIDMHRAGEPMVHGSGGVTG